MKKLRLPGLLYNWVSILGAMTAVIALMIMTVLYVIGVLSKQTNPYLGIVTYLISPFFLLGGLLLIPIGMFFRWRRLKKARDQVERFWPSIDLNQKGQRKAAFVFFLGTFLFFIISAVGSYESYHFTESLTFCGRICHKVMKPEYTAYQNSPHARVACVECHVGPGADWYAKSKLSGLYQVYATLFNKYPRPIPTPIKNLRPARETCEQCHWPQKFFASQQQIFDHYLYDEKNTHWPINLLIKTGGGDPRTGKVSGIHWHMYIDNQIEYIARDSTRLDIPWVKKTDLTTGQVTIYQDTENPLSEEEIKKATPRLLDCMDCHDRPSHIYNPADHAIDQALLIGLIDKSLRAVKKIAVQAMSAKYETEEEARLAIAKTIDEFYQKNYPDVYEKNQVAITQTIETTQREFFQNIFPYMGVRWDKYPNNIGHFYFKGCFRCHSGTHSSKDGQTIFRDCNTCHVIISQGSGDQAQWATSEAGLEFKHPVDISEAWKEMGCYECHSGIQP
jgi:hypothetical protein